MKYEVSECSIKYARVVEAQVSVDRGVECREMMYFSSISSNASSTSLH